MHTTTMIWTVCSVTFRKSLLPKNAPRKAARVALATSPEISDGTALGQLTVQYVRMEIDADVAAKTFQFYKRRLKRSKDYSFPQGE